MTDLRGHSDVSRDAIVPLQVDAASGPEEVISERALETGSRSLGANAWRDLRRRPMFWISLALIVLFRRDGGLPAAVHEQGPELRRPDEGAPIAF